MNFHHRPPDHECQGNLINIPQLNICLEERITYSNMENEVIKGMNFPIKVNIWDPVDNED